MEVLLALSRPIAFILATLLGFIVSNPALAQRENTSSSTVTIPIQEYLNLVKAADRPRFVSILGSSLTGRYGDKLRLEVNGQASSLVDQREFLRFDPQNISFDSCAGDAQIAFNGGSASLLPSSPKFSFHCVISVRNWSQVRITFVKAMGSRAEVSGAEALVITDSQGNRSIQLSKASSGERPVEEMPISAVGRFRITLLPEATRFDYRIDIENPSRNTRRLEIPLRNGETLSRVTTESEFSEESGRIVLRLRPGSNSVRMEGALGSSSFSSPIEGGPHYLLIENHQLLQVSVTSSARRISAQDANLMSRFAGQRAYLLQGGAKAESFTWETKKLEVLAALGFTIESAHYNYFIARRGHGLVEATLQINNQGQPEIPLPVEGKPLYLEVDGLPQVLATNPAGDLLLQLSPGRRRVYVQYEAPAVTGSFFGAPQLRLAKPVAVMSQITSTLGFEDGASVLWAQGLGKMESDLSSLFPWVAFFVVLFATLGITKNAGLARFTRAATALSAAVIAALSFRIFLLIVIAAVLAWLFRSRHRFISWFQSIQWTWRKIAGTTAMAVIAFLALSLILSTAQRFDSRHLENFAADVSEKKRSSEVSSSPRAKLGVSASAPFGGGGEGFDRGEADVLSEELMADAPAAQGDGQYQGLPARVNIPPAARTVWFRRGLLEAEASAHVMAAYIHPGFTRLLVLLGLTYWTILIWRRREELIRWVLNRNDP